jgi:hypothetical protein
MVARLLAMAHSTVAPLRAMAGSMVARRAG